MAEHRKTPTVMTAAAAYLAKFGHEFPLHTMDGTGDDAEIVARIHEHIDTGRPAPDPIAGKSKIVF